LPDPVGVGHNDLATARQPPNVIVLDSIDENDSGTRARRWL
jgi:hypothetical protein